MVKYPDFQTALLKTEANIAGLEGLKCHRIFRITSSLCYKIFRRHKQLQLYKNTTYKLSRDHLVFEGFLFRCAWSFPQSFKAIYGEPKKSTDSVSIHTLFP